MIKDKYFYSTLFPANNPIIKSFPESTIAVNLGSDMSKRPKCNCGAQLD